MTVKELKRYLDSIIDDSITVKIHYEDFMKVDIKNIFMSECDGKAIVCISDSK
jgi:hypothetical protein